MDSITFKQGGATRLTTVKTHDQLNRLSVISSQPSASSSPLAFAYTYNSANQRTRATREDNSYWAYSYDALGQVTAGARRLQDGAPMLGHDFAWSYDDIGNRKTATVNSQISTYSPNSLNQHTARTVPGIIDVLGAAQPDATVKVTASGAAPLPVGRQGETFYAQLAVNNATKFASETLDLTEVKNHIGPADEDAVTVETRRAFVPQSPESFNYDADGNLTGDARWTYVWDGENRLIRMTARPEMSRAERRPRQVEFAYDGQGRRVQKRVTQPSQIGVAVRLSTFSQPLLQGTPTATTESGALDLTQTAASAQWNGTLRVPTTGLWTLKLEESASRGYRLWVDGVVRFSAWPASSTGAPQSVTLALEANRDHALRIDNNGANSLVRLKWSGPDTVEQVIPAAWSPVAGAGETVETTRYLYDGWNLIAEFSYDSQLSAFNLVGSYIWGLDLSGSFQGAGGVGGLLLSTFNSQLSTHASAFDGNGNVIGYVDLATGDRSATYEYGAFGETLIADGVAAEAMPIRFSTKYTDPETGLLYYGLRYYSPSMGRWLSRDPIEEEGPDGPNLYAYVGNDPINAVDPLGLYSVLGLEFDEGKSFLGNVGDYAKAAGSGAAQGGSCWAKCMAQGAGIPIGAAGIGLTPMTPIPMGG